MSTEYPQGTVAMVTALNRREPYRAYFDGGTWREVGDAVFCVDTPETIRPLVVLDSTGWSHVVHILRNQTSSAVLWDLANKIEEQTAPPKPAEPMRLGAVVEDRNGNRWVRCENADLVPHWYGRSKMRGYSDLDVVRVLSEGAPA